MNRKSLLKLGVATMIAISTMLAAKPAKADLCVFSYMQGDRTCTYVGNVNGCCQYDDQNGRHCPPRCVG